uniref:Uncharacterized protein n=1 Tax=Oryza nivara TaxID=4536 RepID=A0A0E0G3K5_ORYNI
MAWLQRQRYSVVALLQLAVALWLAATAGYLCQPTYGYPPLPPGYPTYPPVPPPNTPRRLKP